MQDFFQTFWEILAQNKSRVIFIFLSSIVLHIMFRRFTQWLTNFVFVTIRSFFYKDVRLLYDRKWKKSRYIKKERLDTHYQKNLALIYDYDNSNKTNYFAKTLNNSRIKKVLHILLDLNYLKSADSYTPFKKSKRIKIRERDFLGGGEFDFHEMSYATLIYKWSFYYEGLEFQPIKGIAYLEKIAQEFLSKQEVYILQNKKDYTFHLKYWSIYIRWLWVVFKLNLIAFKKSFNNSILMEIDKNIPLLFQALSFISIRYKTFRDLNFNVLVQDSEVQESLHLSSIHGKEDFEKLFTSNEIESVFCVLYRYGGKINLNKFKHQNLIHSLQSKNYDNSLKVHFEEEGEKIIKYNSQQFLNKGMNFYNAKNKLVNGLNISGHISNFYDSFVRYYMDPKTYKIEFSLKYFELNKNTLNEFKDLQEFYRNELGDNIPSRLGANKNNFGANPMPSLICANKEDFLNHYYKYFGLLEKRLLLMLVVMKKSWFFYSSNRIIDKYFNWPGFLLFFLIAFVLEEIYSEPIISLIEKTTSFFSSLF